MGMVPEDEVEEFRLDRTQFSVKRLTDRDDAVEYWLSRRAKNLADLYNFPK